jgi:hypothetical protein
MMWNKWIRQAHRWLSMIFTLAVLANFAVMPLGNEMLGMTVGGLTLIPLVLLLGTGLYLFVLPYLRRSADST